MRALVGVGWLATLQGDYDTAQAALAEALRISPTIDAPLTAATVLHGMALLNLHRGRYDAAAASMEQALDAYRALESIVVAGPQYVSSAYALLGRIALARGDTTTAEEYINDLGAAHTEGRGASPLLPPSGTMHGRLPRTARHYRPPA